MLALMLTTLTAQAALPWPTVASRLAEIAPLRGQRLDRSAPTFPSDTWSRAAAGQIVTGLQDVEGHKAKKVWGVAVVEVPIGRFWSAVNDDASKVEWTSLDYVELVEGQPCASPRRVFQFLPVPLLTDRWWLVDVRANDALQASSKGRVREQVWTSNGSFETPTPGTKAWSEKGMHIVSTQGSWFLVDLDGRHTLIEYYTWADPGGSIPAGLASSLAASSVDDTITNMAALARKGPGCPVN